MEGDNENEDEERIGENHTTIMLQTQEGRKSRIKFLIYKVEYFQKIETYFMNKNNYLT